MGLNFIQLEHLKHFLYYSFTNKLAASKTIIVKNSERTWWCAIMSTAWQGQRSHLWEAVKVYKDITIVETCDIHLWLCHCKLWMHASMSSWPLAELKVIYHLVISSTYCSNLYRKMEDTKELQYLQCI